MAFTTRLSIKLSLFAAFVLCLYVTDVRAEGISIIRAQATITRNGQLSINSRFNLQLPDQLKQALNQGVPLNFDLNYQLNAPTLASYRNRINNLIGGDNLIQFKLAYHPLTSRYRVSMGPTFSTEYNSLDTALKAIGAVANWRVLSKGILNGVSSKEVHADIRLSLSISQLPKPFQINALTSHSWQLDSGWHQLTINAD
ncbi:MAG: DUF4390 domain-containing protein [Snodgrassella sp.]|nr:DUF4390 domain-containing protein [Snodgrassella sp.]